MRPPTSVSRRPIGTSPRASCSPRCSWSKPITTCATRPTSSRWTRVAKALIRLHGVAMVQGMTRPLGRALEHASIPYLFTTQGSSNGQQLPFNREQNSNTDAQADIQAHSVAVLRKEIGFFQKVSDELHQTVLTVEDLQRVSDDIRAEVSNVDDFFRPIKSYFY